MFSKEKVILNNINGEIHFGTLTALIGPSGVGKSTLLTREHFPLYNSKKSLKNQVYRFWYADYDKNIYFG